MQNKTANEGIDLIGVSISALRRYGLIAVFTFVCGAAGVLYAVKATPYYVSSCKFITGQNGGAASQLSGLASLAGLSLPKTNSIDRYFGSIIQSRDFLDSLLVMKWKARLNPGKQVTIGELIGISPDTTKENFTALYNENVINALAYSTDYIEYIDDGSGLLILNVYLPDPMVACSLNVYLVSKLKEYAKHNRKQDASEQRLFVEARLEDVQFQLRKSENALEAFRRQNQNLTDPRLQTDMQRYTREVEISNAIYLELRKQLELAKIEEVKNTGEFLVIEGQREAVKQIKPKKKLIVVFSAVGGMVLGFLISLLITLFPTYRKEATA